MTASDAQDRLARLVAAYGADPARWPEQDRGLAALLDPAMAGEARALDALLAQTPPPAPPSAALIGQIMDGAPAASEPWWRMVWPQTPKWAPAAALSVALLAGFGTGALVPAQGIDDDTLELAYAEEIDMLILSSPYDDAEGALP